MVSARATPQNKKRVLDTDCNDVYTFGLMNINKGLVLLGSTILGKSDWSEFFVFYWGYVEDVST